MFKKKKEVQKKSKRRKYFYLLSFTAGIVFVIIFNNFLSYTSTNDYCKSCHVHPQATQTWKLGNHYDNSSGVIVDCVDCHLPPEGFDYLYAKTTTGLRDVYGKLFKNDFDWIAKSSREEAAIHTYKSGCLNCHQNLFPLTLSKKGEDAHLYYDSKQDELRCINCHLETGHYHKITEIEKKVIDPNSWEVFFNEPAKVTEFTNFEETLPNSRVSFNMVAIPEGSFKIGTPDNESFRKEDEGPQKEIKLSKFWMGEIEVSWDEYHLFLTETGVQGRTEDQYINMTKDNDVDAVSGPTPAYGNPGQGWGRGTRPAITMTHYAALKYCEWLSEKTGRNYRLPTEAEWEYACRAGDESQYFFEGDPSAYSETGFWNGIFGYDTTEINSFVIYKSNSNGRTDEPAEVLPNSFGLRNMSGNVKEFCSDWYSPNYYDSVKDGIQNPYGAFSGKEKVVRGGSFKSDAADVRSGKRDHTFHDKWMLTDPQIPKSIWWYSDCNDVGFRVVCEFDENLFFN